MTTYTKIRFLLGLGAIFALVYLLNGMPCLGDANVQNGTENSIRSIQNNGILSASSEENSLRQSLVVPKLSESELDKVIWGVLPSSIFEKVESIGRRHISTEAKGRHYIVKEGDSLWSIASKKLGDPSRYKEISKLNTDILKNDHDLSIGMRLSLPDSQKPADTG